MNRPGPSKSGFCYKSLKKKDLAYGRLPRKETEIVIGAEEFTQNYEELKEKGESLIGKTFRVDNNAEGEETVSFINPNLSSLKIAFDYEWFQDSFP